MAKLSKFDSMRFYGGYDDIAISKQRHSKEEAIEIAKKDYYHHKRDGYVAIGEGYVRHRYGMTEDNEPMSGWWLEYEEHKRSCPCWVIHWCKDIETNSFAKDYEYIPIK